MGTYLNPGDGLFKIALNSQIFVDKSRLLEVTNRCVGTMQRFVCVSRPRRFGKSMAADMLAAYYQRGMDSDPLFRELKIADCASYSAHRNQYDVIKLNMQEFLSETESVEEMLQMLRSYLIFDLKEAFGEVRLRDEKNLVQVMKDIYGMTGHSFVILIDEWDCLFREYQSDKDAQKKYLDFLRAWLKDKEYVALAYMTGILPIKKYGSHSALNMFSEYSMTNPREMAEFFGFTEEEVQALCEKYGRSFEETQAWYDGYELTAMCGNELKTYAMYSPKSVVDAMLSGIFDNYWNQTETYEALKAYIRMNFEGLKDDIVRMLAGERIRINIGTFSNDMTTFYSEDDVLTLLIHLGYLGYDFSYKEVFIPNSEVRGEYINAVAASQWGEVSKALKNSSDTLQAIWQKYPEKVAEGIEQAHFETAHIQSNDENALSYTISLALYAARNFYTVYRELPTGKGLADMVFLPRRQFPDKPALVVELKWNHSAEGALAQIKEKQYCKSLEDYRGNILLVGVNYDKVTREHTCVIEEAEK